MKPNFNNININEQVNNTDNLNLEKDWVTAEQIPVKKIYTK